MKLSKLAASGIKWTSVSQVSKQIIQYVTTIILASLLDPTDFGLIVIAMVVIGFLEIFKDLGTSAAIIHSNETSNELLSSIFYANVFFGLLISVLILLFSSIIGDFYNNNNLIPVLNVLAISFFISSISIVQKSILEKDLKFGRISIIELFSACIGAATGIVFALSGYGVWSLVFQSILNNFLISILFWIYCKWRPSLLFRIRSFTSIIKYSSNLIGYNILNYLVRNVDYILIGKFLGDKELGHYYIAYKIMLYPVSNISSVISRVMFPVYSKVKFDLSRFRTIYTKVGNTIALITFPLMFGLFSISNPFANLFFANNWESGLIGKLLMILAPVGLIQSVASTTGSIYQATGRTDLMFRWGIVSGVIYVGGFVIGVNYGVTGVAISYLVSTLILLFPVFAIPFKIIDLRIKYFGSSFIRIFIASIIMIGLIYLVRASNFFNTDNIFQFVVFILIAFLGYSMTIMLIYRKHIFEILTILKS